MEFSCPWSLTTPGLDITFNGSSQPRYYLDPEACSWTVDKRVPNDPAPQASGVVLFDGLDGAGHLVLSGILDAASASDRNTLYDNLDSSLAAILAADGTVSRTPSGGSATTLRVRLEVGLSVSGGWQKRFTFGLIAADPTWS